jgi:hypothetical protein
LIALGAVLANGCATASVRSVRDPYFRGQISRLAVVIAKGPDPQDAHDLSGFLEKDLAALHVQCRIVVVDSGLELHGISFDQLQSDAVLTIAPTAVFYTRNGYPNRVRYDAGLWPRTPPGKRVWRAEVEHANEGIYRSPISERLELMASRLVENLAAAGMFAVGSSAVAQPVPP